MITTLMPHLSIGPYKEGVLIVQIQMPFYPIVQVGRSFPYELLLQPTRIQPRHNMYKRGREHAHLIHVPGVCMPTHV